LNSINLTALNLKDYPVTLIDGTSNTISGTIDLTDLSNSLLTDAQNNSYTFNGFSAGTTGDEYLSGLPTINVEGSESQNSDQLFAEFINKEGKEKPELKVLLSVKYLQGNQNSKLTVTGVNGTSLSDFVLSTSCPSTSQTISFSSDTARLSAATISTNGNEEGTCYNATTSI